MPASLKIQDILLKVEQQMLLKQNRIGARKLAERLCAQLEIHENPQLIPHFTRDPHVKTLVEAIAVWFIGQMPQAEIAHTDVFDPMFIEVLRHKLRSLPENDACP